MTSTTDEDGWGMTPEIEAKIIEIKKRRVEQLTSCGYFPPIDGKPKSDPLADLIAEMQILLAQNEAHRSACTERYCAQCGRNKCAACDALRLPRVNGHPGTEDHDYCLACGTRSMVYRIVPERYRDARAHIERRVKNTSILKHIAEMPDTSVVLFLGATGAGKSSLAAAMVWEYVAALIRDGLLVLQHGFRERHAKNPVLWVSAIDLAREAHTASFGENRRLLSNAEKSRLVVIDDLGNEAKYADETIKQVIMTRHDRGLRTWVTTGFSSAELTSRYGGQIERRLYEGSTIIQCGAPSRR